MTKVILLKDVPLVGQKGNIKEVKDGYFRNFLMPQKLAVIASPWRLHEMEQKKSESEAKHANEALLAGEGIKKIMESKIIFKVPVNEKGHLFDGIGVPEIETKLREAGFENIKKEWIKLEKPIKEVGEHSMEINTPFGSSAEIKITVTGNKAATPKKKSKTAK